MSGPLEDFLADCVSDCVNAAGAPTCGCKVRQPRPAPPVPWTWITREEELALRQHIHRMRQAELLAALGSVTPTWREDAAALANAVEELLVELRHRRPAGDDVTMHLGGARPGGGRP